MKRRRIKAGQTLIKLAICVVAIVFITMAAAFDCPWWCAPGVLLVGFGAFFID
jgi:hypothetical protein